MKKSRFWFVLVLVLATFAQQSTTVAKLPDEYYTFLPVVQKSVAELDISIANIEVTQAVQTPGNSVPLVEGRPTFVRVYASTAPARELQNVTLSLAATRNGVTLPGSPLTVGPKTIPTSYSRADLNTSYNVQLPASWLSGVVTLAATIDSKNVVPEFVEDNVFTTTIGFNYVPPLNVVIVPMNYTHNPTGQYFPGPTTDIVGDFTMRIYPISKLNVSMHAPVAFSGDLSSGAEWSRYLRFVTDLKNSEGAPPSTIYYGYVYLQNPSGARFTPPYAGMAWIGSRTAVGAGPRNVVWGTVAAHEFGHNLGRYHAPCGNAPNPDLGYPYAGGVSGQYGYDIIARTVKTPTLPDIMTYCEPEWVSDYTYVALYENQRLHGAAPGAALGPDPEASAPVDSFLASIAFDVNGIASFSPVYQITAPATAAPDDPGEYTLELLDAEGQVVAGFPLSAIEAETTEEGIYKAIHAVVPRPVQPVDRMRLVQGDVVLAERVFPENRLAAEAANTQAVLDNGAESLTWGSPSVPALVRYSPDSGLTWTTLAIGVLGGSFEIPYESLPGGECLFQVILADSQGARYQFRLSR